MSQRPEDFAETAVKYASAVTYVLLAAGTLTLAWAIWSLWPSPEGGYRAVAAAKTYYKTGMLVGFMLAAMVAWQRRGLTPSASGLRGLCGWIVAAALAWAAMHAAALAMLPTTA